MKKISCLSVSFALLSVLLVGSIFSCKKKYL